jgi:hypothetical protein
MGRAGRQGQPGSVQQWIVKDQLVAMALQLGLLSLEESNAALSDKSCYSLYAELQAHCGTQARFQRELSIQADRHWTNRQVFSKGT